jgi:undecaprenyl-diphosphatase
MRRSLAARTLTGPHLETLRLPYRWLLRQEAVVLVAAFFIVLAVYGFVAITSEIREGELRGFDEWALRLARRPDDPARLIGPAWLTESVTEVTALGSPTVLTMVLLSATGYLVLQHRYDAVVLVAIASAGGGALTVALKGLFGRGRPDVVPRLIHVNGLSFPSGHSMEALIIYLTLGALLARFTTRRRVRAYVIANALSLTFLIGLTRICLGVHYPTDVLAGWSAGLAWALLCWLIARYLQYRGAVEAPASQKAK